MERRGVYRKGSAHHPRNINPYLLYRQHIKKWRVPVTLALALLFVLGLAPRVGDDFQASIVSSGEMTAPSVEQSSSQLRKTLMNGVKAITSECGRFALTLCKEEGDALLAKLSRTGQSPEALSEAVTGFIAEFQTQLAWNSCKFDLGEAVMTGRSFGKKTQQFIERYGKSIDAEEVRQPLENFTASLDALELFVEGCRAR